MKWIQLGKELIKNGMLNPFPGMGSFWIQRVTGIILALYIFPHVLIISSAKVHSAPVFTKLIGAMDSPVVWVLELVMVLGIAFHMLNGLRIIFVDFFPLSRKQLQMLWLASLGTFVIIVVSTVLYLPKFIYFFAGHAM
jgi:succinate dehydrogenase / fumarate reductase cytochrome b subunit